MILWTIQSEAAVRRMERAGALRGDGRRIWREYRDAHQWIVRQMRQRLGPPPPGSSYPVWAWKVYSTRSPRPDLRHVAHLPRGTRGARIEFDSPEERVLLSDFMRWHAVLNNSFCADNEQEDDAEDARPRGEEYVEENLKRIKQSWSRIFELERGDPAYHGDISERSIQATLWLVELHQVRSMTWFTAR